MTSSIPAAEPGRRRAVSAYRAAAGVICALFTAVTGITATAAPAAADLVVFDDGHFLHVESYRADGDEARLELPSGGVLLLPLHRVTRVVDDAPIAPAEPAPADEGPAPFALRFADGHPVPDVPYGDLMHRSARRHGLNPELVAAVARAESAYRADAVSVKGPVA